MSDTGATYRPAVGIFGLTGCAGDQLQILNCEDELLGLAERLRIVDWVMVSSRNDHECALDIAFVEGVVATRLDLARLRQIRARARTLVALGTCAVWGGLPAMREPRAAGEPGGPDGGPRPVGDFVPVDLALPGCPIERAEFLRVVLALVAGTRPELPPFPVCWECKLRENPCLVVGRGEVCCGAMTRGGCGARCPSHGVACAGCRGPLEEPNFDANITMFRGRGLTWIDIARRMQKFSAPAWVEQGLEREAGHERSE